MTTMPTISVSYHNDEQDHHLSWWDPRLIASSSSERLPEPEESHAESDMIPDMEGDDYEEHEHIDADEVLEELFPVPSARTDSLSSSSSIQPPPTPASARFTASALRLSNSSPTPFPSVPNLPPHLHHHLPHGTHHHRRRPSSISSSASSLASARTKNTIPRSILSRSNSRVGHHAGSGNSVKFADRPIILSCRYEEDEVDDDDDVDSAYASADEGPSSVVQGKKKAQESRELAHARSESELPAHHEPLADIRPPLPRASSDIPVSSTPHTPLPSASGKPTKDKTGLLRRLTSSLNLRSKGRSPRASSQPPPPLPTQRGQMAPPPTPTLPRPSKDSTRSAPPFIGLGRSHRSRDGAHPPPPPQAARISGPLPLGSSAARAAVYNHTYRMQQAGESEASLDARSVRSAMSFSSLRRKASEYREERGRRGLKGMFGRLAR